MNRKDDERSDLTARDWLGLREVPDWTKSRLLGGFVSTIIGIVAIWIVVLLFGALVGLTGAVFGAEDTDLRGLAIFIAAAIGAPFLVWRSIVAQKTVDVSEHGQVTDRINAAVVAIGTDKVAKRQRISSSGKRVYVDGISGEPDLKKPVYEEVSIPNMEVRLGGIYALGRIAQESLDFHIEIMEILCAYVRENAPKGSAVRNELDPRPTPRTDIQATVSILGKRNNQQIQREKDARFRLYLDGVDLSGCSFRGLNFFAAQLSNSHLDWCDFVDANLDGALVLSSRIDGSRFFGANLRGTRFDKSTFDQLTSKQGGAPKRPLWCEIFRHIDCWRGYFRHEPHRQA